MKNIFRKPLRILKSKKALFIIIPVVAVILFILYSNSKQGQGITISTAKKGNIKSTVTASGEVKSETSAKLNFFSAGKVAWVNVKQGDKVTKWQSIASLDPEPYQIALRQAQQTLLQTDATLEQTYNNIHLNGAENYDQRVQRQTAETAKNQAYDALLQAQKNLRDSTIYAPIEGSVVTFNVVPGQQVQATTDIGTIADINTKNFVALIDETDVGKIALGQSVVITLDAYSDDPMTTTVEKIADQSSTSSTGATAFEVTFSVPSDIKYKIGMNGEAEITTDQQEDVLIVPAEAIVDEKYVWVKQGKNYLKKEIQKGIESDTEVQITSGLSENEQIVTAGQDQIGKKSFPLNLFSK